jgi:hypothetical protein
MVILLKWEIIMDETALLSTPANGEESWAECTLHALKEKMEYLLDGLVRKNCKKTNILVYDALCKLRDVIKEG